MNEEKKKFIDLVRPGKEGVKLEPKAKLKLEVETEVKPEVLPVEQEEVIPESPVETIQEPPTPALKKSIAWSDIILWVIVVLLLLGIYPLYLFLTR